MQEPLVSCVCPTLNRAAFIPRVIKSYQSQTYPHKELVIVDNGTDDTASLIPASDPTIRYIKVEGKKTTGDMRNLCAEHAHGQILCHFDSDDWSAPERVKTQVIRLLEFKSVVVGFHSILFYDERDKMVYVYRYPKPGYALGTSLCYLKEWWSLHPFPSIMTGEDTRFFSHTFRLKPQRVATTNGGKLLVASVHNEQTSRKRLLNPQYHMVHATELPHTFHAIQHYHQPK